MVRKPDNLIWIDLEMTGLNVEKEVIIEIATIVTDSSLNVIAESADIAIHQPDRILSQMDEWNSKQHLSSGLIEAVRNSRICNEEAQEQVYAFLEEHAFPGQSPMCGNSVCLDRRFLYRHMPKLERFFHYRNLDVSTVKELAKRWAPNIFKHVQKDGTHRAINDIKESIKELQYYREHFFNIPNT